MPAETQACNTGGNTPAVTLVKPCPIVGKFVPQAPECTLTAGQRRTQGRPPGILFARGQLLFARAIRSAAGRAARLGNVCGSLPGWAVTVSWRSASSQAWGRGTGMPGQGCCIRRWSMRSRSRGSVSGGVIAACGSIGSIPVTGTCGRKSRRCHRWSAGRRSTGSGPAIAASAPRETGVAAGDVLHVGVVAFRAGRERP